MSMSPRAASNPTPFSVFALRALAGEIAGVRRPCTRLRLPVAGVHHFDHAAPLVWACIGNPRVASALASDLLSSSSQVPFLQSHPPWHQRGRWRSPRPGRRRISTSSVSIRGLPAISLSPLQSPHQCRCERFAFTRRTPAECGNHAANLPTDECESMELARPPKRGPRPLPARPLVQLHLSQRRDFRPLRRCERGGLARNAEQRPE